MPNSPARPGPGIATPEKLGGVPPIAAVSTSLTALIGFSQSGPLQTATPIASFAHYQSQFGPLDANSDLGFAAHQFFSNGGGSLYIVRAGTSGGRLTPQLAQAALRALDDLPSLNLLCLPGVKDTSILAAATAYCEKRRAFFIIDADASATTAEQLTNLMNGSTLPRSASAAVYGPWLEISDPLGPGLRTVAPSGAVAAIYARTDANSGVWKAPAGPGAVLLGVVSLAATFDESQALALNQMNLNLLRAFPGQGILIWGARTLVPSAAATPSPYEYVSVRRLALFLEESISRGTGWAAFEANAPALWTKITMSAVAFLQALYLQGAFQGSTPVEAYFVKCDATTMTQSDIDRGVVNILVGFAPLRPAEFVILQIQQLSQPRP